jgi:PEP-CTERM putative exosortase interaction domain
MQRSTRTLAAACLIAGSIGFAPLHAEDVFQIANSTQGWNSADYWGAPATAGNDYFSLPGFGQQTTAAETNGYLWTYNSTVRDNTDPGSNSTFAGDSLTLVSNTRLLGKVVNGSTSTVNLVFGGGFFFHGGNTPGSATLAGTIRFADGINLGAIVLNPNGTVNPLVLTINSAVIGGSADTLQLTLMSEGSSPGTGNRIGHLIFAGDLSGFAGTIWVGTSDSGTGASSFYSVRSSSVLATLALDPATHNFRYELATDETFGSLVIGDTILDPGTYSAEDLNATFGTGEQFFGEGSITVVPEPSTFALFGVAGILAGTAALRRRARA